MDSPSRKSVSAAIGCALALSILLGLGWTVFASNRASHGRSGDTFEVHVQTCFGNTLINSPIAPQKWFCLQLVGRGPDTRLPEPVAWGKTDHIGRATIEFDALEFKGWIASGRQLEARLMESGYQHRTARTHARYSAVGSTALKSFQARLAVVKGGTLDVRPLDDGGRAIPDVELTVLAPSATAMVKATGVNVGKVAPGLVGVHFSEKVAVSINASGHRQGTGRLDNIKLAPTRTWLWGGKDSAETIELKVRGKGVIKGRLLDAAGSPSAAIDVRAIAKRRGHGEHSKGIPPAGLGLEQLHTTGLLQAVATTDSNGRFLIEGLAENEAYALWAKKRQRSYERPSFLGSASTKSGAPPFRGTHGRPHLVVDLKDVAGAIIPGSETGRSSPARHRLSPLIRVVECRADGQGDESVVVTGSAIPTRRDDTAGRNLPRRVEPTARSGDRVFDLTEGSRYLVGVVGDGFRFNPRVIEVPPKSGQIRLEFQAAQVPRSELLLTVSRAGEAVEDREVDLVILDPETLTPLLRRPFAAETSTGRNPFKACSVHLPADRYLVSIVGPDSDSLAGGGFSGTPRQFGRTEVSVELHDQRHELHLTLEESPVLILSLTGKPQEKLIEQFRLERRALTLETLTESELRDRSTWARVFLGSPDGRRVRIPFANNAAERGSGVWKLGVRKVKGGLPIGRHELSVELVDGREKTVSVELRAGITADIQLDFDP